MFKFYTLYLRKLNLKMKFPVPVLLFLVALASCGKTDTVCPYNDSNVVAPATEIANLSDSLAKYNINADQAASGFFYKVNSQGSGASVVNLCSIVTVSYKGMFFNGKIFDSTASNQTASFQLGEVITGWQKAIPLVNKGGDIDLYVPPSLGYGANAYRDIPGNSYLIFNVHVSDIQ